METFIKIAQFITSLGFLILLHEFGHFIAARMFKIRVEKFYLFFDFLFPLPGVLNFSLFKKKVGDTEYGLGWFPMGGYVSIAGMIDENLNTEQMDKPAEPWEFRSKPAWQRLIVMLGGIIVNVILAFLIFAFVLFIWGDKKLPISQFKDGVVVDSIAQTVGFQTGDKIIAVDNKKIAYFEDVRGEVLLGHTVTVERNGEQKTITLPQDFIDLIAGTESYAFIAPRYQTVFGNYGENSLNATNGMRTNDIITAVDSIPTLYRDQMMDELKKHKNGSVTLSVLRNGNTVRIPAKVSSTGTLGIELQSDMDELEKLGIVKIERRTYGFFESFPAGVERTFSYLDKYIKQFKKIFSPSTGAYKHLSGFGGMTKMFHGEWIWEDFWTTTGFLSIILAFMNLLPIPALDGGHVVFTLYEMVTRRKPSVKVLTYAQYVGMAILLTLMIYANANDIFHFGRK